MQKYACFAAEIDSFYVEFTEKEHAGKSVA